MRQAELVLCAAVSYTRGAPEPGSQSKLDDWAGLEIGVTLDTFVFSSTLRKSISKSHFQSEVEIQLLFSMFSFFLSAFFFSFWPKVTIISEVDYENSPLTDLLHSGIYCCGKYRFIVLTQFKLWLSCDLFNDRG